MNVERVVVRILADTSSYVRHMALAEYGLHRFGQNIQRINQRTAQAVAQVEQQFASTIAEITQRRDTAMINAHSKYHDSMSKITSQKDKELIAAQKKKIQTEQAIINNNARAVQSYQNKMLAADKYFEDRKIDISNAAAKKLLNLDNRMRQEKIKTQLERDKEELAITQNYNKKKNDLLLQKPILQKQLEDKLSNIQKEYDQNLKMLRRAAGVGTPEFDRSLFSKGLRNLQIEKKQQEAEVKWEHKTKIPLALNKLKIEKDLALGKVYDKYVNTLDQINEKYATMVNNVTTRRDQLLQRAEDKWKEKNAKYNNAINLSNQQRIDSLKKAEEVYLARVAEIKNKFAKSESEITKSRDDALGLAQKQWDQSKAKAEQLRKSRLAAIKQGQTEAMREARERQDALADAHYLTAKTRVIQGAVVAGAAVGAVTLGLTSYAVRLASEYERTAIAFEVMMKSAEGGLTMLKNIERLAVETPFHSQELAVYAKELMAFGVEIENLVPALRSLGDVSAGTGGRMDRLVLAFGQVMTAGRLMGQEVRQFTNAGVPILEYLSKVIDKPVHQVRQMIHRGDISSGMVISAFKMMTEEGGRFAGMMDRINKETVSGRWENLRENLQINIRNFALAAFEGLGLANAIGSVTESLGRIDQDAVRKVFEGIRKTFIWIKEVYNNITSAIQGIIDKIKQWITVNENARNTIMGIAGILIILIMITRAIATLVTVTKLLIIAFNVLAFAIKLVTGWKIAYTVVMKMLTIATYAQAIAATKAWLAALGPVGAIILGLTAAIIGLIVAMKSLGYYEDFGKGFARGFNKFMSLLPIMTKAIKDLFSVGDMEGVFDTLWVSFKIGLKIVLAAAFVEIISFISNASLFLFEIYLVRPLMYIITGLRYMISGMLVGAMQSLSIPVPKFLEDEFKETRADLYEGKLNERINRWMEDIKEFAGTDSKGKEKIQNYLVREWTSENEKDLRNQAERAHLNAALESKTARNIADLQLILEKMTPQELNTRGAAAVAAMENPVTYQKQFQALQQMSEEFGTPQFDAQERYKDLWQNVAKSTADLRQLQRMGISSGPVWDNLVSRVNQATKELDDFSKVLEKVVRTPFDNMKEKWEYPPKIVDYIDELRENIDKGVHPVEQFSKHVDYLNKSFNKFLLYGKDGIEMYKELPNFAQRLLQDEYGNPFVPGIIDEKLRKKGLFSEYEKMRKAIGEPREALAPAQLYGSREAQETINRAQKNQMDDTTRIITTIQRGNYLLDKSVQYQQQTSEILKKLADNGTVILKVEDLPGSDAK